MGTIKYLWIIIVLSIIALMTSTILAESLRVRCGEDIAYYYIWRSLDQVAQQEGWYNVLNSNVIKSSANSWNNVRPDDMFVWPLLKVTGYSYDIIVTVDDLGDNGILGQASYYGSNGQEKILINKYYIIHDYYESSSHMKRIVAHEFGHTLGANDLGSKYYHTLMYQYDNYKSTHINSPTSTDVSVLLDKYDTLCSGGGCLPSDPTCPDLTGYTGGEVNEW